MKQENEDSGEFQLPFHISPRTTLFILTVLCICSMGYHYFKKENIVSVSQAAGLVTVPFQKAINSIGHFFFQLDQDRLELDEALAKIESLEAENESLAEQIKENEQLVYDYQDTKALLELKDTYSNYDTVSASVVFRDASSNWFSAFTIDRGSTDGIETGMNVIADGGLVGYISDVSSNYATVTTIINDKMNVSGVQQNTKDSCIVVGDLTLMEEEGLLRLEYMDSDFKKGSNSKVLTSQISDRYLPGILIGYIEDVSLNSNKLSCSGTLRPAVDFEHINYVLVITTQKEISD